MFFYIYVQNLVAVDKVAGGSVAEWLGSRTCDQQVVGSNPGRRAAECNHGKLFTHMCLCQQSLYHHHSYQKGTNPLNWLRCTRKSNGIERSIIHNTHGRYHVAQRLSVYPGFLLSIQILSGYDDKIKGRLLSSITTAKRFQAEICEFFYDQLS